MDGDAIFLKVSDANEAHAKGLGKPADQLTESERKDAFQAAALTAIQAAIAKVLDKGPREGKRY